MKGRLIEVFKRVNYQTNVKQTFKKTSSQSIAFIYKTGFGYCREYAFETGFVKNAVFLHFFFFCSK
jgi:hypothetical protein